MSLGWEEARAPKGNQNPQGKPTWSLGEYENFTWTATEIKIKPKNLAL